MQLKFLIALIFAFTASAASAQPKPALVQDRDEPGRAPYVESLSGGSAGTCNAFACTFDFATVPLGKRLVITYVATSVALTDGSTRSAAFLFRTDQKSLILPAAQRTIGNRYAISAPVTFFVDAGSNPIIEFQGDEIDPSIFRTATLTGYYISIP